MLIRTGRDLLNRHSRLTHNPSGPQAPDIRKAPHSRPSWPTLPVAPQYADVSESRLPGDGLGLNFVPSPVAAGGTLSEHQAASNLDFLGFEPSLESFPNDFTAYMDSVPIPSNAYLPSLQPIPAFSPGFEVQISATSKEYDVRQGLVDEQVSGQMTENMALPSPFSSRLPSLQPEEPLMQRPPSTCGPNSQFLVSAECREHFLRELAMFSGTVPDDFILPSRHTLSRLVIVYFNAFHEHYPFLHVPTLSLHCISLELFLAIIALGARYARELDMGVKLFRVAKAVVMERIQRPRGKGPNDSTNNTRCEDGELDTHADDHTRPFETVQALVLLIAIASWFHRSPDTYEALSLRGVVDSLIRQGGLECTPNHEPQSWQSWVQMEMLKRTKLVAFCFFNIHTIAFDLPPLIFSSELDVYLPFPEQQWKAENKRAWQKALDSADPPEPFQGTLEKLFDDPRHSGGGPWDNSISSFSPLGGFSLIHAIIQRIWLVHNSRFPGVRGRGEGLSNEEMSVFERALKTWSLCWEHGPERSIDPMSPHGPLSFTSTALLRLAYIRINLDLGPTRSLTTWNPSLVAKSLDGSPGVERTEKLTRAVLHCAHALSIPVKLGTRFVARNQVIYWSNQHALCSLECAVLLAKWLEVVTVPCPSPPLRPTELRVLHFLAQLVAEGEYGRTPEQILARRELMSAALVRMWGTLYNCDSVWEMVTLIGQSLFEYAALLESHHSY